MSLIKFDNKRFPWFKENLSSLLDFDDVFSDDFFVKRRSIPAVNIKEAGASFLIELAVPGFSKDEIEIAIEDGYLKVEAEKEDEKETPDEGYTRKEFSFNSFERSFKLPTNANENEEVKAVYKDGILSLSLAKKDIVPPKEKKIIAIE